MTRGTILLDMTRATVRRWNGSTPSGIDRVADAYAAHFAGEALAVLQVRGRAMVLDEAASGQLFAMLDRPRAQFRREFSRMLAALPGRVAPARALRGASYINVSHTDFDLASHWEWIARHDLRPIHFIHDLIPLAHPEVTTAHKVARHRGRVERSLQGAAGIIVSTESGAEELRRFAADRHIECPPILSAGIAGPGLPIPLRPAQPDPMLFVSVGTIEKRKNHILLLDVWERLMEQLGERTPRLVIAGSWGRGGNAVRRRLAQCPQLSRFVEVRPGLDDLAIAELVGRARAVLLPTLAEGFGLPLVEALQLRVPVIASNLACFREIGGGIPSLLDPHDIPAWTDMVRDMLAGQGEFRRQASVIETFRAPTWDQHFAIVERWLHSADERRHACAELEYGIYTPGLRTR